VTAISCRKAPPLADYTLALSYTRKWDNDAVNAISLKNQNETKSHQSGQQGLRQDGGLWKPKCESGIQKQKKI
jgi:hypothetical protein